MDLQVLTTSRLRLEPMTADHADELFDLFQDPSLYPWITREAPASIEAFRDGVIFLEGRLSRNRKEFWLNWVSFKRDGNKPKEIVGKIEVSIKRDNGDAHLAYYTFSKFQRRGYAREGCQAVIDHVFQEWNAQRIVIEMDVRNPASVALAESLGAKRIHVNPKVQYFKGSWSDEYLYEIVR